MAVRNGHLLQPPQGRVLTERLSLEGLAVQQEFHTSLKFKETRIRKSFRSFLPVSVFQFVWGLLTLLPLNWCL